MVPEVHEYLPGFFFIPFISFFVSQENELSTSIHLIPTSVFCPRMYPHQMSTLITTHEPTLTCPCHSRAVFTLKFTPQVVFTVGLVGCMMTFIHDYCIILFSLSYKYSVPFTPAFPQPTANADLFGLSSVNFSIISYN